jgi:hypothetical protein
MLVDHKIKVDVETELKTPPPRLVRRRSRRPFVFGLRHLLVLPLMFFELLLIWNLLKSLSWIIAGRGSANYSTLMLTLVTLFWSCTTAIYVWRIYALPFVYRWLVVRGQATLGHVTELTGGSKNSPLRVHYEFSTDGSPPIKSAAQVISIGAWEELKEGNTVLTILYWQKNPGWNVPYICADYEAVSAA